MNTQTTPINYELQDKIDCFTFELCANCIHEKAIHEDSIDNKRCNILASTLKGQEPKEWTWGEIEHEEFGTEPICSQYQEWDWGTPGDWNEPTGFDLPYVSRDPNQLSIPFQECQ